MNCSVIIPVYNGAETVPLLIERLGQVLPGIVEEYEAILVNDGSQDRSWDKILELAGKYPWVIGLNLARNYGQHNALLCAIRQAKYEVVVTMDDDLQHPPEEIPHLLTRLQEGYDVVYGIPRQHKQVWWRSLFAALTKRAVAFVMRTKSVRDIGSFRALRTHLREAFGNFNSPEVILDVLLSWGTDRFAFVSVDESPRNTGNSNYNFWKLARVALTVMVSFSTAPLRMASIIGFLFTLVGVGVFIYVLVIYFSAGSVPGFPFLASIISLFSGAQLFALGIMGEYLARVYDRTATRPCFVIKETTAGKLA
jgi:glycosyltransferase involved in cell wall biosynthesis